jgi:hypothetical protein
MGRYWNFALHAVATIGAVAAAIVATSPLGIVPAAVIAIAVKVVGITSLAAITAAKLSPGMGENAPPPAGSVVVSKEAAATQIKP